MACSIFSCRTWDLVPWPGTEPRPPALGTWSFSDWTTRKSQEFYSFWHLVLAFPAATTLTTIAPHHTQGNPGYRRPPANDMWIFNCVEGWHPKPCGCTRVDCVCTSVPAPPQPGRQPLLSRWLYDPPSHASCVCVPLPLIPVTQLAKLMSWSRLTLN